MNIQSAQYIKDSNGNQIGIQITHDSGQICIAPIGGATWVNEALNAWVSAGGTISPAS